MMTELYINALPLQMMTEYGQGDYMFVFYGLCVCLGVCLGGMTMIGVCFRDWVCVWVCVCVSMCVCVWVG